MLKKLILTGAVTAAAVFTCPALTLDLTGGASGAINGALFVPYDISGAGVGNFNAFLILQEGGPAQTRDGIISGYNTDLQNQNLRMPDVASQSTELRLGDVPLVNGYYQFALDLNESANLPLISLDQLQIFTRGSALADASVFPPPTSTLRYNMDAGGDNSALLLNYNLFGGGSGKSDLLFYIPSALFPDAASNPYVYLFAQMGATPGYEDDSGYAGFGITTGAIAPPNIPGVPDAGSSWMLLSMGLAMLGIAKRSFRKA